MNRHCAASLVLLTALLLMFVSFALAEKKVVFIQLLHRHGARTPLVTSDAAQTAFCGGVGSCGQLNIYGQAQLRALGQYLRARYVDDLTPLAGQAGVFRPSATWKQRLGNDNYRYMGGTFSVSTDINRTLQSADAMLRGLFPNMSSFYPVVHTVSIDDLQRAQVLLPGLAISYLFAEETNTWPGTQQWDPRRDTTLTVADLLALGDETNETTVCGDAGVLSSNIKAFLRCALGLRDVAASFEAMGMLPKYPLLRLAKPQLDHLTEAYFAHYLSFTPKQPGFDVQNLSGSTMFPFFQEVFKNSEFELSARRREEKPSQLIYHFSAHDTTIAPAWAATNHNQAYESGVYYMRPEFGETMIIEFLRDEEGGGGGGAGGEGKAYVQMWSGRPANAAPPPGYEGNTPAIGDGSVPSAHYNFSLTMKPVYVMCMDKGTGEIRNVTDGSCEYEQWRNFIQWYAAPRSPDGLCYITPELRNSPLVNIAYPKSSGPAATIRKFCGAKVPWACPSGYIINISSPMFDCVQLAAKEASTTTTTTSVADVSTAVPSNNSRADSDVPTHSTQQVVEVGVGAALGGALLGLVIGYLLAARRKVLLLDSQSDSAAAAGTGLLSRETMQTV